MDRTDLEVVLQVRACRSESRAGAKRGSLAALPSEPPHIETVLIADVVVRSPNPVVAVACRSNGAEKVVERCRQRRDIPGAAPRPEAAGLDGSRRKRADIHGGVRAVLTAGVFEQIGGQRNPCV